MTVAQSAVSSLTDLNGVGKYAERAGTDAERRENMEMSGRIIGHVET